ncbi:SGT1-domain-containing protein [Trametes punicea]|nr:SGT1-domain-containing protein [Trametes punicea]
MVTINDIFNRPPTISEDTLQYLLYLPPDQSDRVSATTLAALLTDYAYSILPDHLWHRDSFELRVAPDPEGNKDRWVLEGRMRVGDCIDDEWCAVWLLREISGKWDVVVSVWDSDGEFLLIEAADELPSWVTPSNAENRVWIHNSRLHLIPLSHISAPSTRNRRRRYLPHHSAEDEEQLDENGIGDDFIIATDAVKLVRDPLVETTAPENVEQVVWNRISGYPAASRQHVHITKVHLSVDVAKALVVNPPLVQKAVETFYTRDALQLRAAQKMTRFPPEPSVLVSIKMTRTAYAQLVGQRFHPPKVFGRWAEREGSKEWRWRDIGMKIACGFEMLYQESKNRKETLSAHFDGSPTSADALKDNLRRNAEYSQYIQRLASAGYFKGELENSQQWKELETRAAVAFVAARKEDDASRPSFAAAVQVAINQYTDDRGLPSWEEDSDDWLNVDAAALDAMLEKTMSATDKGKERAANAMDVDSAEDEDERIAKAQAARLKDIAKKVEEFVEGEGDIEGARFADEAFSDEGDSDDSDHGEHGGEDEAMDQDEPSPSSEPPHLTEEERKARQEAMDKLVPAIDPSDYGKMPPSFHRNSQRTAPVTLETEVREEFSSETAPGSSQGVRRRPIRPPLLPRDEYDGVDSDDETDEDEDEGEGEDDEHPQVVGEVEIDMAEEEEEFIEFARQALGVSDEQWKDILKDRGRRGAFVPAHVTNENKHIPKVSASVASQAVESTSPQANPNTSLDSFEAVMRAMDAELARARGGGANEDQAQSIPQSSEKGKGRAEEGTNMDIEAAMEAELRASLEKGEDEADEDGESQEPDYQLIKNFLESFNSQAGLSGPVSNLVGRLQQGWTLPRDES